MFCTFFFLEESRSRGACGGSEVETFVCVCVGGVIGWSRLYLKDLRENQPSLWGESQALGASRDEENV